MEATPLEGPFSKLRWESEELFRVGSTGFLLRVAAPGQSPTDGTSDGPVFTLRKHRPMLEAYSRLLAPRLTEPPRNVFELGLWEGGSAAWWFELLKPACQVGVDREDRSTEEFRRYERSGERDGRLFTYWDVDQADKRRLRELAAAHFDGPLDLVVDDASHLYSASLASLEALLPLLRPGGLYVIEDWSWAHYGPNFRIHGSPDEEALTRLVFDLIAAIGSPGRLIRSIGVAPLLLVFERGAAEVDPETFRLDDAISWSGSGFLALGGEGARSGRGRAGFLRRAAKPLRAASRAVRGAGRGRSTAAGG